MPSTLSLANGQDGCGTQAYLFTLLAASMLLLQKLEVELFLLLLVELLELLLQKKQEAHVRVPNRGQWLEECPLPASVTCCNMRACCCWRRTWSC